MRFSCTFAGQLDSHVDPPIQFLGLICDDLACESDVKPKAQVSIVISLEIEISFNDHWR